MELGLDINTFRGILTGVLLALFIWLTFWAYSKARHAQFEEAARLPLEDDEAVR